MHLLTRLLLAYAIVATVLVVILLLSRRRQRRRYQHAIREVLRRKMDSEAAHKERLARMDEQRSDDRETPAPAGDAFFEAFCEVVRENGADPSLDIPQICRKMLVSRSKLYSKITPVAGMSPKHYLQNWRLQRAASLLAERKMNISEVAEAAGFNSLSYFSKSFKRLYGVSPKEY